MSEELKSFVGSDSNTVKKAIYLSTNQRKLIATSGFFALFQLVLGLVFVVN